FFPPVSTAYSQTWVEDTFEDFRDGRLDAAGQNIYVCRDGTVRTIHRFDLNQDGFIDLLFNSTHDTSAFIPARLAAVDSKRAVTCGRLAVEGSIQAELADFNRDGFTDVVFCPNASGVQNPRRFLTIIWGGPDGWPAGRANGLLPVHGAGGIAVADLNRDSWPDIAVLNDKAWMPGQPAGRILRVYWGGPRGFSLSKYKDIGIPDASGIAASDFDGDGVRELAVLTKKAKVIFLWRVDPACGGHVDSSEIELPVKSPLCLDSADFDRDGLPDLAFGAADAESVFLLMGSAEREWRLKAEIAGLQPSRIVLDDLDEDGFVDLVVNSFSISRAAGGEPGAEKKRGDSTVSILWGGPEGFSAARSTGLRLPHASATAVGDADGDGRKDVAVAVYQGAETFAAESRIFFSRGGRRFELDGDPIPTEGALDAAFAPAEKNLPARLVFCNSQGGFLLEKTPTLLYWGGQRGFDPGNVLRIPFRSGYEATAADLNADGFPDLVAVDSMHAGQAAGEDIFAGANIFWGGERGFDFEDRRTVLTENSLGTSNTADLDKDGKSEFILADTGVEGTLCVLDSKGGELWSRPEPGIRSIAAVDVDGDGRLEVLSNAKRRGIAVRSAAG
ncbi:MAG TPA: VCBS repeat-containing protein, partial [Candidatus Aminicenantes bacterium]|nr:VCBS repeat-containing protein [Candidatus Aminicenantes bacterium]